MTIQKNLQQSTLIRDCFSIRDYLFGISTAPALFQHTMESLLQGLTKVYIYIDDILVADVNEQDHLHYLGKF